jgi:hypothetical protein
MPLSQLRAELQLLEAEIALNADVQLTAEQRAEIARIRERIKTLREVLGLTRA